jgi:shikimate dehydrogenase
MSDPVRKLNSSTRLIGLIGWPVAHSRSPAMQNAAFAALGLNYAYVPLPVSPGRVNEAVRGLAALGFAGANVTVPHKEAVLAYLDEISPVSRAIASTNTLVVRADGTIYGDSTDGAGFLADLRAHEVEPAGQRVLLLGAGGAARAVACALATTGAAVAVANRTPERAEALCKAVQAAVPGAQVAAFPLPGALPDLAAGATLVVNATSLGLHGAGEVVAWDPAVPFRPGQVVYDLVYSPAAGQRTLTPFLALAAAAGAHVLDGLGMLVQQGARSFEIWTGHPAPLEEMFQAVLENMPAG